MLLLIFTDQRIRNFAGIVGPLEMTWETDLADWRKVIEINTIGALDM